MDSFDTIEDWEIRNGPHLTVLIDNSLHRGVLPVAWSETAVTAREVVEAITEYWRFDKRQSKPNLAVNHRPLVPRYRDRANTYTAQPFGICANHGAPSWYLASGPPQPTHTATCC